MPSFPNHPIFLAGPTAVGKSEIALRLAEHLGGEIISVDSMQVYRGLDIGTAKPSPAERQRVPHHLVDVVELTETFDAAKFVTLARKAVGEITARGRVPILCGGTGLYFKAFREGLGQAPPSDPALRAELEATPLEKLLKELRERDPVTFGKVDQKNPRRIIRALEVIRLSGRAFSVQRAGWNSALGTRSTELCFGLSRSANDLRHRIDVRVDEIFRRGFVDETRRLLERGLAQNPTALQAIGYRQVVEHLQDGRSLSETTELVKIRTRQFAKRQLTWFKKHAALTWLELTPEEPMSSIVERIATEIAHADRRGLTGRMPSGS